MENWGGVVLTPVCIEPVQRGSVRPVVKVDLTKNRSPVVSTTVWAVVDVLSLFNRFGRPFRDNGRQRAVIIP